MTFTALDPANLESILTSFGQSPYNLEVKTTTTHVYDLPTFSPLTDDIMNIAHTSDSTGSMTVAGTVIPIGEMASFVFSHQTQSWYASSGGGGGGGGGSIPVTQVTSDLSLTTPGMYWWPSSSFWSVTLPNASTVNGQIFYLNALKANVSSITEYPTPGGTLTGMCAGPDGNLWFLSVGNNTVCKVTTSGVVTEYAIPIGGTPISICIGPDSNLWFTERTGNRISRVTTSGVVTEYPLPTSSVQPITIVTGPDNNLWFTEEGGNNIAKFTPGTFAVPSGTISFVSATGSDTIVFTGLPNDGTVTLTGGTDFTDAQSLSDTISGFTSLGSINSSGTLTLNVKSPDSSTMDSATITGTGAYSGLNITFSGGTLAVVEYPIPTGGADPYGICVGPDGNLWFTEAVGTNIGRCTTSGVITEFPTTIGASSTFGIVTGPDNNLWFIEARSSSVCSMNTSGVLLAQYTTSTPTFDLIGICVGSDNNLWVSGDPNNIIRVTTTGGITEYPIPTAGGAPEGICNGPDNDIWFTENSANNVGKASLPISTNNLFSVSNQTLDGTNITTSPKPLTGITLSVISDGSNWHTL